MLYNFQKILGQFENVSKITLVGDIAWYSLQLLHLTTEAFSHMNPLWIWKKKKIKSTGTQFRKCNNFTWITYILLCNVFSVRNISCLLLGRRRKCQNIWKMLTVCSYHATYVLQSESTLYSCLNVEELLVWSRSEIWSLSDCNWIQTMVECSFMN